jgi:hypothetical protein
MSPLPIHPLKDEIMEPVDEDDTSSKTTRSSTRRLAQGGKSDVKKEVVEEDSGKACTKSSSKGGMSKGKEKMVLGKRHSTVTPPEIDTNHSAPATSTSAVVSDCSNDSNSSDGDANSNRSNSGSVSPTKLPSTGPGSPSKRAKPNLSVDTGLANETVSTFMSSSVSSKNSKSDQVDALDSAVKGHSKSKKGKVSPTDNSGSVGSRRGSRRVSIKVKEDEDGQRRLSNSDSLTKPPLHGGPASGCGTSLRSMMDKDDLADLSQPKRRRTLSSLATIAQEFLPEGQLSDRSPGEWRATDDKFSKLGIKP